MGRGKRHPRMRLLRSLVLWGAGAVAASGAAFSDIPTLLWPPPGSECSHRAWGGVVVRADQVDAPWPVQPHHPDAVSSRVGSSVPATPRSHEGSLPEGCPPGDRPDVLDEEPAVARRDVGTREAVSTALAVLESTTDTDVLLDALRVLARAASAATDEPRAAATVLALLARTGDAEVALAAGSVLDVLASRNHTPELEALLARAELPETRVVLVRSLVLSETPLRTFEERLLRDPSAAVRAEALRALVVRGAAAEIEACAASVSRDEGLYRDAPRVLAEVPGATGKYFLEQALAWERDPGCRDALVRALVFREDAMRSP